MTDNVVPTLAIGVGMGGVSVIKEFIDFVKINNVLDDYRFIAIDSNIDDLNKIIGNAPNTSKIEITDHSYNVNNLRENCPYLHNWVITQKGGALRERVYGRFLLDLHKDEINRTVTTHIRSLVDLWKNTEGGGEQRANIAIWIVHSLGGGTGSGSFPALAVYVQKIVKEILEHRGISSHIYGVGILPSGTNITDLSSATFTKRYFANSFAALEEVRVLASASEISPVILYPPFNSEEIKITKRPFERYFLFGIDEELTTRLRAEGGEIVDDYLSHANKIIVNMMYTLPQFPKGLENLWNEYPVPYVAFGESELNVPIELVKQLASKNDLLGVDIEEDKEKKSRLNQNADDTMQEFLRNMSEENLENRFLGVFYEHRLIGLSYYAGKVQNLMNIHQIDVQTDYESYIDEWWGKLENESWSCKQIAQYQSSTIEEKDRVITLLFKERIEENQRIIDSYLVNPLRKPALREKKEKIEKILENLENKRINSVKVWTLKQYVDTRIGEKLPIPISENKAKPYGVGPIVEFVRREISCKEVIIKKLRSVGSGRLISLIVPLEKFNKFSLIQDINVSQIHTIPDFIGKLGFLQEDIDKVLNNRINQACDRHLTVAFGTGGKIISNRNEIWILCNEQNENAIATNNNLAPMKVEKITNADYDMEKCVFIDFTLNLSIEDIREYSSRKEEYNNGNLKEKTEISGPIGTIFAYPEWFKDDPEVRNTYPKFYPEET